MKKKRGRRLLLTYFIVVCCLLVAQSLFAADLGLVLDQNAEYAGAGDERAFVYKGIAIPRLSGLLGESAEFIVSAGFNYKNEPWEYIPELLQTGVTGRAGNMEFEFGRMTYADPLGYVACGLFDGAQFAFNTDAGKFSAGAWYAGLLYKKRVNIEMTDAEWTANNAPLDYGNFVDSYFAPRRVLAALDWENKGLWERALARLAIIGQFDLTEEKLHTQYAAGKVTVPFKLFSFDLGGCFELIEVNEKIGSAFAAECAVKLRNPAHYLSLGAKYSSGAGENLAAFLPLTTNTHGQVLKPKLSANTILTMDYVVRLHETFSFGLYPAYFILNDAESVRDKRFLGGEVFGALYWSPVPDISINLGGGAFLPSIGDVAPDENVFWRVELNIIVSIL